MVIVVGLYVLWVAVTYLLEGLPRTLLRPEAQGLRLVYTLAANLVVGTLGSALVLHRLANTGVVSPAAAGFGPAGRSLVMVPLGLAAGGALSVVQGAPLRDAVVVLNAFAQVLPVSIAEVLVCWSLVGVATNRALASRALPRGLVTAVVASAAFGVYHAGHSPPFNTPGTIALLAAVGLVTSVVFLATRDVYGTIAFHNWLGVLGVLNALAAGDGLAPYAVARPALLVTALGAVGLLIVAHVAVLRARPGGGAGGGERRRG